MKKVYYTYAALVFVPLLAVESLVIWAVYLHAPGYVWVPVCVPLLPTLFVLGFILLWIPRYFASIRYELAEEEVRVRRGVWWKMKHTVPYSRIMSVDVIQGPISRHFGLATVDVHTAGYTGTAGGSGGPGSRRAEASIMFIPNAEEVREWILQRVRSRPLFGGDATLSELRAIRELLEKSLEARTL